MGIIIKYKDLLGHAVSKETVMGNKNDSAVKVLYKILQYRHGVQIQIIGRLIQKQYIGLLH